MHSTTHAMHFMTDEKLIRLFVQHEAELRAFAMTLLPSPADAEDVVQDACVAMWKRMGDLNKEESFRSWAYTFVRFTALNHVRKRQRSPLVFSDTLTELMAEEGSEEQERAQVEIQSLASCIQKLPDEQRELIQQYYNKNKVNMKEVAQILQRNTAGLYKALERTRDALKTCIESQLRSQGFESANSGN